MGKSWPTNVKFMSQKVKRLEEDLRKSWGIVTTRLDVNKNRGIMFSKPGTGLMEQQKREEV